MKKRILEIILAFIVGAFTCCVFFSVIGLVTVYIEMPLLKLTKWYRLWPKDIHYRIYFGLFESIAVQLFAQIPVTAFSSAALGLIITRRPGLHGFVAALGAISFYIYGHLSFVYGTGKTLSSLWDILSSFTIFHIPLIIFWVMFFTLLTCSGYELKRNGRTKSDPL
jgi:ABC-type multidrug transport system permease subunit